MSLTSSFSALSDSTRALPFFGTSERVKNCRTPRQGKTRNVDSINAWNCRKNGSSWSHNYHRKEKSSESSISLVSEATFLMTRWAPHASLFKQAHNLLTTPYNYQLSGNGRNSFLSSHSPPTLAFFFSSFSRGAKLTEKKWLRKKKAHRRLQNDTQHRKKEFFSLRWINIENCSAIEPLSFGLYVKQNAPYRHTRREQIFPPWDFRLLLESPSPVRFLVLATNIFIIDMPK